MRIVIDGRQIADHFPGIGRYVYALARELAELDHGHELVLLHNPALRNTRFDIAALGESGRIRPVATGARPFTLAEQRQIPRVLRAERADLFHAPYYVMPYIALPCPAVVTLYDIIPRLFPAEVPPHARLLFDLLTRLAIRAASGILTISESARADLVAAFGLVPNQVIVTPLAADKRYHPQPTPFIETVRQRYELPERYVLCLSSNKPHKNLPALVAAWDSVRTRFLSHGKHTPLLVVAGHEDARYPEARLLAEQRNLANEVRFLSDVADADLPALYSGAELFVYPSRYEGFGLPPLEAMACGAPVVCGVGSSLGEVVGDAALTVDVTRPHALAAGVQSVLADGELRERMRRASLQRSKRFSWRRTAELTLAAYERVLKKEDQ